MRELCRIQNVDNKIALLHHRVWGGIHQIVCILSGVSLYLCIVSFLGQGKCNSTNFYGVPEEVASQKTQSHGKLFSHCRLDRSSSECSGHWSERTYLSILKPQLLYETQVEYSMTEYSWHEYSRHECSMHEYSMTEYSMTEYSLVYINTS